MIRLCYLLPEAAAALLLRARDTRVRHDADAQFIDAFDADVFAIAGYI